MAILQDPIEVAISSLVYITLSFFCYFYVQSYGSLSLVRPVMYFHNRIQLTIALFLLCTTTISMLPTQPNDWPILNAISQQIQSSDSALPRLVFHCSKFYEYLDIWLVILQGKADIISLHFMLHHLTTPWYTTLRVIRSYQGWQVFAWLNAFHHAFSECPVV
jgi:hypothetical protein